MDLSTYKKDILEEINNRQLKGLFFDETAKQKVENSLKKLNEKQKELLKKNKIQGTLQVGSDRHPVLLTLDERNSGIECISVREYDSHCIDYYGGQWTIDENASFSRNEHLEWNDKKKTFVEFDKSGKIVSEFIPLWVSRYENPSF